jgi:hypothetical protein
MNKIERKNKIHYLVEWFYQEFSILHNLVSNNLKNDKLVDKQIMLHSRS